MNAGFSSLSRLKQLVLPTELRGQAKWDDILTHYGQGVAQMFGSYCGRSFYRNTAAKFIVNGAVSSMCVNNYPIETVTSLEILEEQETTWEDITDDIDNVIESAGLVMFAGPNGSVNDKVRLTYVGGYWWDIAETNNTTPPTGSIAVPFDLVAAWTMQLRHIITTLDLLGSGTARASTKSTSTDPMELLPMVTKTLDQYRRVGS
jgi:hypothetical protein